MRFWKRSQKPPAIRLDREGSADAELSPAEIERLMEDSVNGDPVARCKLGRFWLERGTELEAMNYFRHAAYQGHKPAWLEIGAMCGNECGVPGTHEDVAKWYMRAAYTGHPTAQLALAGLYREGLGVDADPVECTRLCRLSAEQGGLDAQYLLSLSYEFGTGVKADAEKATKWLSIAAERGHPDAQVRLEEKYRSGVGFRVDADERTRLLTGPAEPGDLAKIAVLAEAHATDSASKENLEEAAKWFRRITRMVSAEALQVYATMLVSRAEETPHCLFLAQVYSSLAAAAGHSSAASECRLLERRLAAREIEKSRAITRICRRAVQRSRKSRRRSKRR